MACGITSGVGVDCNSLSRIGGLNKRVFAFNIDDLDTPAYTFDASGNIDSVNFATGGLYEFRSRKNAHTAGYTANTSGDGGNKYFQHDVILKLFSDSAEDDEVIKQLLVADVGLIVETRNKEFKVYGAFDGMDMTAGTQNSGQVDGSDISDTLTFMGGENAPPNRIFLTDYDTTLAYLQGLVV